MNQPSSNYRQHYVVGIVAVAAVVVVCAVAYWQFVAVVDEPPEPPENGGAVPEKVVADFYTGLAALDVEQNELAAKVFGTAVELQPHEPALWANLAVAQSRLRELDAARKSLEQAQSLAEDSRELSLLRAEVLEHSGETEAAIEQLRQVHQTWPENIAATFSLVRLLGQTRSDEAEAERLELPADILSRTPGNLRGLCEQSRIAATLQRGDALRTAMDSLLKNESWPEQARQQLEQADEAARGGDFRQAALSLTFFENLLKPTPQYQQSLAQLGVTSLGAIGTPLRTFLKLALPAVAAADADIDLKFELQAATEAEARPDLVWAVEQPGERSSTLVTLSGKTLRAGETAALPFPGSSKKATPASVAAADLNFDFQVDLILAGEEGCRSFLGEEDGSFAPHALELEDFNRPWRAVWTFDVEADGDLDLLLSDHESLLLWMRNNGDMTFSAMEAFVPAETVVDVQTVDLDGDGDVELAMLAIGTSIACEVVLGKWIVGRIPPLASAYITGISVGILLRSPFFWPFALCSALSIISKYVLRWQNRHLWNPSNFGVSALLFLYPAAVAGLSIQWGNFVWPMVVVWILGTLIISKVKRFHICLTYVVSFIALPGLRSLITGSPFLANVAPLTGPMYQLFVLFMITDPRTTVSTTRGQCVVVFLVAVVEMLLRLGQVIYAPFYALFLVGPVALAWELASQNRSEHARKQAIPAAGEPAKSAQPS